VGFAVTHRLVLRWLADLTVGENENQ